MSCLWTQAQNNTKGCAIEFQSENYANRTLYLVSHYGKYQTLLDSVVGTMEGVIAFKRPEKYVSGLYLLVNQDNKIEYEFLMDEEQQFRIEIDTADPSRTVIKGSKLNTDFNTFNTFFAVQKKRIETIEKSLVQHNTSSDSLRAKLQIDSLQQTITSYKNRYISKNDNSLALLYKLSQPINNFNALPQNLELPTFKDSLNFLKTNFLKGINFNDERLLRNPFLESRLNTYFDQLVAPNPQSITSEIDSILSSIRSTDHVVFKYLSFYFMARYTTPKVMGNDAVFVNLYNTYFKNKNYQWLDATQSEYFKYTYRILKDNQIGSLAKNLFMKTVNETRLDLYDVDADFIVLAFWDPTCGHCKTEIPKLNTLYNKQYNKSKVKIYAVNVNPDVPKEWKEFIASHKLEHWTNVYPAAVVTGNLTKADVDFQTLYNVSQTPVFYLLDKNKTIIAKDIDPKDYSKFITPTN